MKNKKMEKTYVGNFPFLEIPTQNRSIMSSIKFPFMVIPTKHVSTMSSIKFSFYGNPHSTCVAYFIHTSCGGSCESPSLQVVRNMDFTLDFSLLFYLSFSFLTFLSMISLLITVFRFIISEQGIAAECLGSTFIGRTTNRRLES